MSKSNIFENKSFQAGSVGPGFNLANQVNNFNSIFDVKPLDVNEAAELESLLAGAVVAELITEEQAIRNADTLKQITAEIKAIGRQAIVLLGERVHKARELLKPYKDGTFTRWLEAAFSSRKTGYNALAYYELHNALSDDSLRDRFKKIPQKTAYILASREGEMTKKVEIIDEYHDKSHDEILTVIQERLPITSSDKRLKKISSARIIAALRSAIHNLQLCKIEELSMEDKDSIFELAKILNSIEEAVFRS